MRKGFGQSVKHGIKMVALCVGSLASIHGRFLQRASYNVRDCLGSTVPSNQEAVHRRYMHLGNFSDQIPKTDSFELIGSEVC